MKQQQQLERKDMALIATLDISQSHECKTWGRTIINKELERRLALEMDSSREEKFYIYTNLFASKRLEKKRDQISINIEAKNQQH